MRKKLIVIFSILLLGCKQEKKIPPHIIDEVTMGRMLTDLTVAQGQMDKLGLHKDSAAVLFHSYYKPQVLKKYNIDVAQFDSSFVFYSSDIELYKNVWEHVVDSLSKRIEVMKPQFH